MLFFLHEHCIAPCFPVSWFPVALESEKRGLREALEFHSPLQGLPGKAMGFQLPWTRLVCWPHGLVASTFSLFLVASVGMQRECQPWISLIPPSVGLNSLPLIQCLFSVCCARGIFFLTPCVTSCYFSTNVGRHSIAGRAKQHSVSQTAECIHAEMNSQFQTALKIKSIREKNMPLLLPFSPALTAASHCSKVFWLGLRQYPGKGYHRVSELYFYISSILLKLPQTSVKQVFLNCSQTN